MLHEGGGAVASAVRNAALLLAVVFLSALCASISVSGACGKVTQMAGTVAVAALSATHVTSCITAGSGALATLRDFSKILLPSMCAAAAASGAATSAAAKYAATSLFLDVLLSAETAVLLPLLYLYAGTVICGTTLENDVLTSLSGLLRKAFRLLIIGFASVFTLYLSLTGILTGSADAATAKASDGRLCRARSSAAVADAASTVTQRRDPRSSIGIVGVVGCCGVRHAVSAAGCALCPGKLAAGIAESFADKRVGRLIDGFADVYGFLLGMVGVASLILFLSIASV
ncbi:MAG: stage III sporulation protein AE [Oscillospiraceae bacterium]